MVRSFDGSLPKQPELSFKAEARPHPAACRPSLRPRGRQWSRLPGSPCPRLALSLDRNVCRLATASPKSATLARPSRPSSTLRADRSRCTRGGRWVWQCSTAVAMSSASCAVRQAGAGRRRGYSRWRAGHTQPQHNSKRLVLRSQPAHGGLRPRGSQPSSPPARPACRNVPYSGRRCCACSSLCRLVAARSCRPQGLCRYSAGLPQHWAHRPGQQPHAVFACRRSSKCVPHPHPNTSHCTPLLHLHHGQGGRLQAGRQDSNDERVPPSCGHHLHLTADGGNDREAYSESCARCLGSENAC